MVCQLSTDITGTREYFYHTPDGILGGDYIPLTATTVLINWSDGRDDATITMQSPTGPPVETQTTAAKLGGNANFPDIANPDFFFYYDQSQSGSDRKIYYCSSPSGCGICWATDSPYTC